MSYVTADESQLHEIVRRLVAGDDAEDVADALGVSVAEVKRQARSTAGRRYRAVVEARERDSDTVVSTWGDAPDAWRWRPPADLKPVTGQPAVRCDHGSPNMPTTTAWTITVQSTAETVAPAWWRARLHGVAFTLSVLADGSDTFGPRRRIGAYDPDWLPADGVLRAPSGVPATLDAMGWMVCAGATPDRLPGLASTWWRGPGGISMFSVDDSTWKVVGLSTQFVGALEPALAHAEAESRAFRTLLG